MADRKPMQQFWGGRRVFLTGHTGFKGAWLSLWLKQLGARVTGYALRAVGRENLFDTLNGRCAGTLVSDSQIGDILDRQRLEASLRAADPQVVIHLAAQALVRESYRDPIGTYATNVLGTAHLLQACRDLPALRGIVIVTSDKVYENRGVATSFSESDRLGGHDPYSASKACVELVTASFRDGLFEGRAALASARAGNVIGGGDWSAERLIPDCVHALMRAETLTLRYPRAVRPWQHVLEPLSGYLALARQLVLAPNHTPTAVNFGPDAGSFCSVSDLVESFARHFGQPLSWRADSAAQPAEAHLLSLSSALAKEALDWRPRLALEEALAWTALWYRAQARGEDMMAFSTSQILRYEQLRGEAA